jgi:hypothetical protein
MTVTLFEGLESPHAPLTRNADAFRPLPPGERARKPRALRLLSTSCCTASEPSPLAGEGGAKRRVRGARREFLNFVDGTSPANGKDSAWSTSDRVR